jgi:hypothetical protein
VVGRGMGGSPYTRQAGAMMVFKKITCYSVGRSIGG